MSFTSLTERDLQVMLERIGVGSLDELFADIPEACGWAGIWTWGRR